MIDKLTFTTADFQLSKQADLTVDRGLSSVDDISILTKLCETTDGDTIYGARAFLNSEFYNVTIATQYDVEHNKKTQKNEVVNSYPVARVTLNPWRIATGGDNAETLHSLEPIESAVAGIQDDLADLGILVQYSQLAGAVNRIDVACNLMTKLDEQNYMQLIEAATASGRLKTVDYGDTVYSRNRQTTFLAYSKRAEQALKKKTISEHPIVRCEYRKNSKRAVRRFYNATTVNDIDVKSVCSAAMTEMFEMLNTKAFDLTVTSDSMTDVLQHHINSNNRYWLSNTLRDLGLAVLLENYSIESIEAVMTSMNVTRDRISELKRKIRHLRASNLLLKKRSLHMELIDLLTEQIEYYKL